MFCRFSIHADADRPRNFLPGLYNECCDTRSRPAVMYIKNPKGSRAYKHLHSLLYPIISLQALPEHASHFHDKRSITQLKVNSRIHFLFFCNGQYSLCIWYNFRPLVFVTIQLIRQAVCQEHQSCQSREPLHRTLH